MKHKPFARRFAPVVPTPTPCQGWITTAIALTHLVICIRPLAIPNNADFVPRRWELVKPEDAPFIPRDLK